MDGIPARRPPSYLRQSHTAEKTPAGIKKTTQIVGHVLPKIRAMFGGAVELLLCLGNKSEEEYLYLKEQGATSYILKHETSDPTLNEKLRHYSFAKRVEGLRMLVRTGYKVGTGTIVGLPGPRS